MVISTEKIRKMTTPDEELERFNAYTIYWVDNECEDACFCGGWLRHSNGSTLEVYSLAAARVAIENVIDLPEYSNCTFTIYRRPAKLERVERRESSGAGRGRHLNDQ